PSVILSSEDRQHALSDFGIRRIVGAESHFDVIVVDLPEIFLAVHDHLPEISLAMGVIAVVFDLGILDSCKYRKLGFLAGVGKAAHEGDRAANTSLAQNEIQHSWRRFRDWCQTYLLLNGIMDAIK